jgi:hypothetical protein
MMMMSLILNKRRVSLTVLKWSDSDIEILSQNRHKSVINHVVYSDYLLVQRSDFRALSTLIQSIFTSWQTQYCLSKTPDSIAHLSQSLFV